VVQFLGLIIVLEVDFGWSLRPGPHGGLLIAATDALGEIGNRSTVEILIRLLLSSMLEYHYMRHILWALDKIIGLEVLTTIIGTGCLESESKLERALTLYISEKLVELFDQEGDEVSAWKQLVFRTFDKRALAAGVGHSMDQTFGYELLPRKVRCLSYLGEASALPNLTYCHERLRRDIYSSLPRGEQLRLELLLEQTIEDLGGTI